MTEVVGGVTLSNRSWEVYSVYYYLYLEIQRVHPHPPYIIAPSKWNFFSTLGVNFYFRVNLVFGFENLRIIYLVNFNFLA